VSQHWRPHRVSRIEAQSPQGNIQEGKRLIIIKLERYNEIGELLIENRTTGSQGHVCYWDGGQRISVTMAAVHMRVKEVGMQTGHRGAYNQASSVYDHCRAIKKALAHNNMEIDGKEEGWDPQVPCYIP